MVNWYTQRLSKSMLQFKYRYEKEPTGILVCSCVTLVVAESYWCSFSFGSTAAIEPRPPCFMVVLHVFHSPFFDALPVIAIVARFPRCSMLQSPSLRRYRFLFLIEPPTEE